MFFSLQLIFVILFNFEKSKLPFINTLSLLIFFISLTSIIFILKKFFYSKKMEQSEPVIILENNQPVEQSKEDKPTIMDII